MGKIKINSIHGKNSYWLQKLREYEEGCSFTCLGIQQFKMGFIVLVK